MRPTIDLEGAIKTLKSKGKKVKDIYEALGIKRTTFQAIRARASERKQAEVYYQIQETFPEHFQEESEPVADTTFSKDELQAKMIRMLEQENERLKQETNSKIEGLMKRIEELEKAQIHQVNIQGMQSDIQELKKLLGKLEEDTKME